MFMGKKNNNSVEKYVLPSEHSELEIFSKEFKIDMMEHILNSIESAVEEDLPIIEVFQFKNSDFVITLSDRDYLTNLENIYSYFIKNERYEHCNRLVQLQKTLKEKSEQNTDEKEKR
jgi:hypothetical protein